MGVVKDVIVTSMGPIINPYRCGMLALVYIGRIVTYKGI